MIRLAVVGARGRMGRLVEEVVAAMPDAEVVHRVGSGDPLAFGEADAVVDVTLPQVSPDVVRAAGRASLPVLVGTSGWSADRLDALRAERGEGGPAALVVPNFSLGAVLAARFAEQAATWFDSIEIVEAHHAGKADSPSGTAVATAERIAAARSGVGPVAAPHTDQRARGQQVGSVPVHSLRLDGVLAAQDVHFGAPGEVLTITHRTQSREAYAAGVRLAVRALPGLTGVVVGLEPLLTP
ncbi:4-hydroxy-tetrahydrodipicolinate reductase [Amnibacterium endophyticum]|uniref:4-hydroxy-tetrahydrodipicolinate reductase n=1 Tax=Amnibacterium endophyticum TaxID=2109337 RepID=A0ABW4LDU5_9MICO